MPTLSKLAGALLLGALITQPAITAEKAKSGSTIATVNGVPISQNIANAFISEQKAQGAPDSSELKNAVREELISRELLVQEAKKLGLDRNPDIAAQAEVAKQAVLIRAFVQNFVKKNPIGDDKLKAAYDSVKSQVGNTEYKVRHILVDREDEAKTIIANLKKGGKFDEQAKQSKDPGSKDKGGDLGWSSTATFVKPFADAVASLSKGKFTDTPVKTDFGYHVIQLDDTRPLTPPSFEQVKPQLAQRLQQEQIQRYVKDLRAKAKVD